MPVEPTLVVTVQGRTHRLSLNEFTAVDAKDFRAAVGTPLGRIFSGAGDLDLDMIAGLVWLDRRRSEKTLPFDAVARTMTYGIDFDIKIEGTGDNGDDDPGEASAGDSAGDSPA